MIILLDLNYTLVSNSHCKKSPFSKQIDQETYRGELVESLKCHTVLLITARPDKYRERTIKRIFEQLKWLPSGAYFNPNPHLFPPEAKELMLMAIFKKYGADAPYFAIESNPKTRAMYAKHGIRAMSVEEIEKNGQAIIART